MAPSVTLGMDALGAFHPRPAMAALQVIAFLDGLELLWLQDEEIPFLELWARFAGQLFDER